MAKEDKTYGLLKKIVQILGRRNWLAIGINDAVNILQSRGFDKDYLMVIITTTNGDYVASVDNIAFSEAGTAIYVEEKRNEITVLNTSQIIDIVIRDVDQ